MANSLKRLATGVVLTLPVDLLWVDEFAWQPVEQQIEYTLTGAIVVEQASKQAGRPITLASGEDYGWIQRSTLETLNAWRAMPGEQFEITVRDVAHTVVFDHSGGAIEATPVFGFSDPVGADFYVATLRTIEV